MGRSAVSARSRRPGPAASTMPFTSRPGAWDDGSIMAPRPDERGEGRDEPRAARRSSSSPRDRPGFLARPVQACVAQTVLPADAHHRRLERRDPGPRGDRARCASTEHPRLVTSTRRRPAPCQRNIGVDQTSGDPVFLIDDDVRLSPTSRGGPCRVRALGTELAVLAVRQSTRTGPARTMISRRLLFGPSRAVATRGAKRASTRRFFVENVRTIAEPSGGSSSPNAVLVVSARGLRPRALRRQPTGYACKEDVDFSPRRRGATSSSRRPGARSTT